MSAGSFSSVCHFISQRAQDSPDLVALAHGKDLLTYAELEAASARLGTTLSRRGIKAGDLVPLLTTRCLEAIVCLVSVLRIGACYVPVDLESWSTERITTTLQIIKARTLVTTGESSFLSYDIITAQEVRDAIRASPTSAVPATSTPPIQPSDLAYVIFTSGTTSAPKGVMVPHRALANYVQQGGDKTPFNMNVKPSDKALLLMSIAFDACTGVVFSTLCNGGTLIISNPASFTEDAKICSILPATPSILNTLQQPEMYQSVRGIFLGGEPPSRTLINAWCTPTRKLFNCYGPTETTCASLITELRPHQPITLGYPMSNSDVILLDGEEETLNEGEICISGPGLATGYFGNPTLTDEKFRSHKGTMFYHTGDIAKRTSDGLEFVGRVDALVKNRGFLINLEAQVIPALQDCPEVMSASAVMHQGRLVGFVTPLGVSGQALRARLAAQHDSFIVPDQIHSLHALPLTGNGKVHRRALQESLLQPTEEFGVAEAHEKSAISVLRRSLSNTLKIATKDISDSTSFWDLGGNSLAAVMLVSQLRSQGYAVSIPQLFQLKNVREIAEAMSGNISIAPSHTQHSAEVAGTGVMGSRSAIPINAVQLKMLRASIEKPLVNYMLLSIDIKHKGQPFPSSKFRSALETIFERHSMFRTRFDLTHEVQIIKPRAELDWQEVIVDADAWESAYDEQVQQIRESVQLSATRDAISSTLDPATIFRVISNAEGDTRLLWMLHHSRVDGWSMGILFEEIQALLDNRELQKVPQFSDIALVQDNLVREGRQQALEFWSEALDGHLPPASILLPKPDTPTSSELTAQHSLRTSLTPASLEFSARALKASSATIIYSAWAMLLSMYSASDKVTFGTVFSGRNLPTSLAHRAVGPLVNTCPLPVRIDNTATVQKLLSEVQNRLFRMNELQWSAAEVIADIAPDSQAALFDTIVALQYDLPEIYWDCQSLPGPWRMSREDTSEFGLTLLIECEDGELVLRILSDAARFESSTIDHMLLQLKNIITGFTDPTSDKIEHVRRKAMDDAQIMSLTQHSASIADEYIGPTSLKDAFEEAAQKWPAFTALDSVDGTLTYRQLDEASNHIAGQLACIVGPGDVVTIVSDGSLLWVTSILGIVKTGATYCPIDVKLPAERAKIIQSESTALVCLVPSRKLQSVFDIGPLPKVIVAEELLDTTAKESVRLETKTSPRDTACIVFTSGSTGKPKGVQAHHLGILSYLSFPPARLHASPGRRNAQLFSVGFDACVAEVFGTLCYGSTLYLKDPEHPFDHLQRVDATMATPSFLSTCRPDDFRNLDTILLGGEAVTQELADAWSQGRRLYNGYGPCECTVGSVFKQLSPGGKVTLGRPIPRMTAYLLDEGRRPVPVGVPGEIYLSGIQVTKGYFGLKAQTDASFVPDPYANGRMMYRTGDLGRWTSSMELQFIGRVDTQVKVRGYRLELGAIEAAIREVNSEITNAVVVVCGDTLRGFVTPGTVSGQEIRDKLRSILPSYSRPAQIFAMDSFPLSVNQKVDRKALAQLDIQQDQTKVALATATEITLAQIWQEAIGTAKYPEPSADDDFADVGGHSLLQIKVGRHISEVFGVAVPLGLVIRNPVLRQLGKALDELRAKRQDETERCEPFPLSHRVLRNSELPVSHLEEEMLVYHLLTDTRSIFNMPCRIRIKGRLNLDVLKQAISNVITESEILRCRYVTFRGRPVRRIIPNTTSPHDFPVGSWTESTVEAAVNESFDIENGQLFRSLILRHGDGDIELLLVAHHIIADKAALASILRQIQASYSKLLYLTEPDARLTSKASNEQGVPLSPDLNYVDWAQWARKRVISSEISEYWRETLDQVPAPPFSTATCVQGRDAGTSTTIAFPLAMQNDMLESCRTHSITSHQLVLAAVALTTHILTTDCSDVVLAVPYMDRYESGTSDLHGLFLDRQLIRIQLSPTVLSSAQDLLQCTKNAAQGARANYMPFTDIRKMLGISPPSSLFDIMVTYHPRSDSLETFQLPGTKTSFQRVRANGAKFPLMFEFSEDWHSGGLTCELEYNTNLFTLPQIAQLQEVLFKVIQALCEGQAPCDIARSLSASGMERYTNCTIPTPSLSAQPPKVSKDQGKIDVVREVYADILGLQRKDVSCQRSFFELGGSSVDALAVVHRLGERELQVRLDDVIRLGSADKITALV